MRRTQEVGEISHDKLQHRLLVLEADNLEEWQLMVSKAMEKGWSVYQDGKVPVNGWYGAWMVKPISPLEFP
jgi:hypothetical protein